MSSIKHRIYFFLACPKIAHCLEMHCYDTAASTICANCEGVVKGAPFYRAYKKSDDRKQCLRMLKTFAITFKKTQSRNIFAEKNVLIKTNISIMNIKI